MSIIKSIKKNHIEMKKTRKWEKTYWCFDIHGTIVKPNYSNDEIPTDMYEHALEVLKTVSNREDMCMIMYTCSHPHEIVEYLEFFKNKGINFEYVNDNPEVITNENGYGCYDDKFYMNVLFDDKSGFDPETDWLDIKILFKNEKWL